MLQTNKRNQILLYNPDQLSKAELINNFIVRLKEFDEIFRLIKTDKMKNPPQHIIVQGQRGMGKTMLLWRLYYAIKEDNKLNKNLIPIIFNEEEYGIRTLSKLWEHIAKYLEDANDSFLGVIDEMEKAESSNNYEEEAFEILINNLKAKKKKLILFVDNFGDMVKKFKTKEIQRFREVLLTSSEIRIIAGSAVVLEFSYDYSHPFYEFLKVFHLKGLTKDETIKLLLQLGELYGSKEVKDIIKNEIGRIEALRRLTNGVPRTIALLFEIFLDNLNGDSFKDLEIILDRVSPLYKHRMDELPPQQQEIINIIALNWDAVTVKEIVEKTGMESKAVSAQLRLLEKNNVVTKERTSTKNHLYLLSERFFNIWYLMRYGNRKAQNRVKFLTRFFEIWCSADELKNRTNVHIKALAKGGIYDKCALYVTEALAHTSIPLSEQDKLIKGARKYLGEEDSELVKELPQSDIELFEEAKVLSKNGEKEKAVKTLIKIKSNSAEANIWLGYIYNIDIKDYEKAKKYYLKAISKGNSDAMFNLALLYQTKYKDYKKAEEYYLKAIEKRNSDAMFNLALLYKTKYKDYKKAEEYYLKAIEKGDSAAMYNLALLYGVEYKDYKKAEEYYLKAIEKGYSGAMYNLALLYEVEYKDYKKAEEYYLKEIEKGSFKAMHNLALLYQNEYKDYKKAEEYYLKAIEKGSSEAMNNLAYMLFERKEKKEKALNYAKKAVVDKDFRHLGVLLFVLLWNDEIEEAVKIWETELLKKENIEKRTMYISDILNFFIAKKQYNFVYNLFQENKFGIKERLKPIYYALLSFMDKSYEDEAKKMGPELKETVDEIIATIKQLEKDYK